MARPLAEIERHLENSFSERPSLTLSDGSLETLKWLALVLMIGDHVNLFLLDRSLPVLFLAGRLVMPLFAFVLAYNLTRPGFYAQGGYERVIVRMIPYGLIAIPFFVGLGHEIIPLNIIFTLLLGVLFCYLIEMGTSYSLKLAGMLLMLGSWFVDYSMSGVLLFVSIWMYFRFNNLFGLFVILLSLVGISALNGNAWAFAAIPVILLVSRIEIPLPRVKHIFYPIYPLHLAALWMIQSISGS
ncbi:MAG: conjugal transfer protein TraX [Candidatus Thiodiazotropha sp. (ex Lucinoma borealis)]|nr:conjugal transfer protein TraX [Candidatus Thiodiazotropha sp. (ex Lucinoma borealis)]